MIEPADRQARIREEAARWHAGIEAVDMDWEAFGAWLDADADHRVAYDEVALLDAEIGEHRAAIAAALPANDSDPVEIDHGATPAERRARRRWMGGFAVAASLVAVVAPQLPFFATEALVAYRTGPSETRTINLKDGSRIIIDRNSALALRDGDSPEIEMASGSANFDIRHDPDRAMLIKVGVYQVSDIGTRFDIVKTDDHLAVAVAEGQVNVAPKGGQGMVLTGGHRIDVATRTGATTIRSLDAASVGSWSDGRLVYTNTPLSLVAVDLSRYAGRAVSVDPEIADMRLSGVLTIGDGSRLVGQIEALLPVKASVQDNRVRLVGARGR